MAALTKQSFKYRDFVVNAYATYKDSQATKMFLELILSISTLLIFAVFALRPTILTIIDLIKQIQTKEELITAMDDKIQDLSRAQSNYFLYADSINSLNQSLPTGAAPDTLLHQLQGVVLANSAEIEGAVTEDVNIVGKNNRSSIDQDLYPNTHSVNISLDASANYQALEKTLNDILNMRIPIVIDTLTLRSNQQTLEEETVTQLNLNLTGRTLYYKK